MTLLREAVYNCMIITGKVSELHSSLLAMYNKIKVKTEYDKEVLLNTIKISKTLNNFCNTYINSLIEHNYILVKRPVNTTILNYLSQSEYIMNMCMRLKSRIYRTERKYHQFIPGDILISNYKGNKKTHKKNKN
jgi:hypothetical protein